MCQCHLKRISRNLVGFCVCLGLPWRYSIPPQSSVNNKYIFHQKQQTKKPQPLRCFRIICFYLCLVGLYNAAPAVAPASLSNHALYKHHHLRHFPMLFGMRCGEWVSGWMWIWMSEWMNSHCILVHVKLTSKFYSVYYMKILFIRVPLENKTRM